jgi:hypothetical protein
MDNSRYVNAQKENSLDVNKTKTAALIMYKY